MVGEEIREEEDIAPSIQCKIFFLLTRRKHLHKFDHKDPAVLDSTSLES